MKPITLARVAALGHKVFTNGVLNLNVIGVRSPMWLPDEFDDRIEVWYREADGGPWVCRSYAVTTDPGTYYLRHPLRVDGTAILCPGQYRGGWRLGTHKGYKALQQNKPVRVWRDPNKDGVLDTNSTIDEGMFGINIHASDSDPYDTSDRDRTEVGRWSAGCQVFARSSDFRDFMDLIEESAKAWGPVFTYTLIEG